MHTILIFAVWMSVVILVTFLMVRLMPENLHEPSAGDYYVSAGESGRVVVVTGVREGRVSVRNVDDGADTVLPLGDFNAGWRLIPKDKLNIWHDGRVRKDT